MAYDRFHTKAPRSFEVITGVIIAIISPLFLFMFLYYPIAIYRDNILSIGTIFAAVTLGLLGIGLPVLSYRLITGKGSKKSNSLFSVQALFLFGLFFGVSSLAVLCLGIYTNDIKMIIFSPFGLVMAYSMIKLGDKRKSQSIEP